MQTPAVEFVSVHKAWANTTAVNDISFTIQPGEFFSLLGPSGCGKTTTLRLLAGFEQPDRGEVRIGGEVMNNRRPYERRLSMVFQNYALFPHLSVERNIAFGLERRSVPSADIARKVRESMELVRLDPDTFGRRMPAQLSGGQRQRVALARALVVEPPILLLDEPLGALDLKLRKEMQLELKTLNRRLGITFVFVTHDQEEALTMSDRIAVMSNARLAQLGTPAEIYERPKTAFVARFIGESNFIEGVVERREGGEHVAVRHANGVCTVAGDVNAGTKVQIAIRPERLEIRAPVDAPTVNAVPARVKAVIYRGEMLHVRLETAQGELTAALRNEGQLYRPVPWREGESVVACFSPEDGRALEEA